MNIKSNASPFMGLDLSIYGGKSKWKIITEKFYTAPTAEQ